MDRINGSELAHLRGDLTGTLNASETLDPRQTSALDSIGSRMGTLAVIGSLIFCLVVQRSLQRTLSGYFVGLLHSRTIRRDWIWIAPLLAPPSLGAALVAGT